MKAVLNTIEDLRSGHFKNSYGVEGMLITGRSDYKKIIDVSDEMKEHVLKNVKQAYYKYNGMSGDNAAEERAYHGTLNEYYKTLDREDRLSACWTLGQLEMKLARTVSDAVKEKVPGWTAGQQIPEGLLDEIFAGEDIDRIMAEKPQDAEKSGEESALLKQNNFDELKITADQAMGKEDAEDKKPTGKVAFNQGKRARQLASAKTPEQVQMVISLLKEDLSDCEYGLANDMCDENEVRKVKAMLAKAQERSAQVAGEDRADKQEGDNSFLINMLM